jgi:hypothetical protein
MQRIITPARPRVRSIRLLHWGKSLRAYIDFLKPIPVRTNFCADTNRLSKPVVSFADLTGVGVFRSAAHWVPMLEPGFEFARLGH